MGTKKVQTLTEEQVRALPVTVDLPMAGRAWGMGRTKSYELARAGDFPCPVQPLGQRFVVTKAALMRALGYDKGTGQVASGTAA
jgi:hypothetical protein